MHRGPAGQVLGSGRGQRRQWSGGWSTRGQREGQGRRGVVGIEHKWDVGKEGALQVAGHVIIANVASTWQYAHTAAGGTSRLGWLHASLTGCLLSSPGGRHTSEHPFNRITPAGFTSCIAKITVRACAEPSLPHARHFPHMQWCSGGRGACSVGKLMALTSRFRK